MQIRRLVLGLALPLSFFCSAASAEAAAFISPDDLIVDADDHSASQCGLGLDFGDSYKVTIAGAPDAFQASTPLRVATDAPYEVTWTSTSDFAAAPSCHLVLSSHDDGSEIQVSPSVKVRTRQSLWQSRGGLEPSMCK